MTKSSMATQLNKRNAPGSGDTFCVAARCMSYSIDSITSWPYLFHHSVVNNMTNTCFARDFPTNPHCRVRSFPVFATRWVSIPALHSIDCNRNHVDNKRLVDWCAIPKSANRDQQSTVGAMVRSHIMYQCVLDTTYLTKGQVHLPCSTEIINMSRSLATFKGGEIQEHQDSMHDPHDCRRKHEWIQVQFGNH